MFHFAGNPAVLSLGPLLALTFSPVSFPPFGGGDGAATNDGARAGAGGTPAALAGILAACEAWGKSGRGAGRRVVLLPRPLPPSSLRVALPAAINTTNFKRIYPPKRGRDPPHLAVPGLF